MNPEKLKLLVNHLKQKKELRGVSDAFVKRELWEVLRKEPRLAKSLEERFNPRSGDYDSVTKKVRAQLRKIYSIFRKGKGFSLESHTSTRERIPSYSTMYARIFTFTGKPGVILDLGCGVNPLSIPDMKLQKLKYYAYDINEREIEYLNSFFTKLHQGNQKFQGKAAVLDLFDLASIQKLPHAGVAFLFKVADVLDRSRGHLISEKVITAIPAKYVVVSFSTKTLSGKKMTAPRRRWMEWMCRRLGYSYEILEFSNELFYVIKK